jgi:hypothetical protein
MKAYTRRPKLHREKTKDQDSVPRDVIITVLGGCVTRVFSDIPNARVLVLDWDNINESPLESMQRHALSKATSTKRMPAETRKAYLQCVSHTR